MPKIGKLLHILLCVFCSETMSLCCLETTDNVSLYLW